MRFRRLCYVLALAGALGACKRNTPSSGGGTAGGGATSNEPPTQPIGMVDPFAAPKGDAAKLLETAYAGLRNKKAPVAIAALQNVITDAPDYTAARWALVRALVMEGRFDDALKEWEPLLARDFVGYAGKLDKPKEFAALRGAPAWPKFGELEKRYRGAYARGLDKGFFFVARTRGAVEPKFEGAATETPLSLRQEVFHYDPDGKRFRRLSDTDGRAFAIDRAPDGKSLIFLVAPKLHRERGVDSFVDPRLGVIDLATLETIGPFAEKGRYDQVGLGTNRAGQPMFTFVVTSGATAAYTIDTARTGLAKLEGGGVIPEGGETRAWPNQVAHFDDKAVPGVKIEDGATQFLVDGVDQPVIAARPIAQSSLAWSASKSKLTYAGKLDACKILKGESKDKNELYVYDKQRRSAQRIAAAVSPFETLWLDDDRLVYEGGVGKNGKIHLYTFSTHADEALPTRHGAGLYGVPTLACEQAETGIDEDMGEEEAQGD
jgi:Tetratricopeptide repeat